MTVAELIEKLKQMPQEATALHNDDGEYWTPTRVQFVNKRDAMEIRACSHVDDNGAVIID